MAYRNVQQAWRLKQVLYKLQIKKLDLNQFA